MTHAADAPDMKPRSRAVTDGLEATAARGMLRAVGMGDDDWHKPQIGVASTGFDSNPCNMHLDTLADRVKVVVRAAGMIGSDRLRPRPQGAGSSGANERQALASFVTAVKPAGSLMAIAASARRSSCTPAFLRPFMRTL